MHLEGFFGSGAGKPAAFPHAAREVLYHASVDKVSVYFSLTLIFELSIFIHLLVVPLVIAARHVVHPRLVVQVPAHGLLDAFLELQARFPAEFPLQLS